METLNVTIAVAAIFGWSIVLAQWILHEPRRWKKIYTPHDLRITHKNLKLKITKIMAQIDDLLAEVAALKEKVTGLQADIDVEQAEVEAVLAENAETKAALEARIAELEAAAGDDPRIAEAIESIKQVSADISTSREDLKGTVADEPEQ